MREYKFRAWDKENKVMCDVSHIFIANMVLPQTVMASVGSEMKHCPSDAILMQFTGLYDKNLKEIYEGDVVTGVNINGEDYYGNHEIVYIGSCFCIKIKKGINNKHDYEPCLDEAWLERMEVIGNIYENPELIKE